MLLLAGCGGDDASAPEFTGSDEEQIAATVNAMTAAIADGEGEIACGLMTDRGQQAFIRIGGQVPGSEGIDSCEAVAPALAGYGYDPGDYRITSGDASIDPEDPDRAQANCDLRGAFLLLRTADGWRVSIPFCVD
jgi:hypothetical protein